MRKFLHECEVQARYGDLIAIDRIERFAKPVMANQTFRQFVQHAIWKRDDPKKFLGHFGIRRFDWDSGWFLFSGVRR